MRYPIAPVSCALTAGIGLGAWTVLPGLVVVIALLVAAILAAVSYRRHSPIGVMATVIGGLFATGVLLGTAALREAVHPPLRQLLLPSGGADLSDDVADEQIEIRGRLRADARASPSGIGLSLDVEAVMWDGAWRGARGGVLVTVVGTPPVDRVAEWRAGRLISMPALLRRPSRYLDPGVPDQELSLARRGTTLVGSVKSGLLVDVLEKGHAVAEGAALVRRYVRESVDRHVGRWDRHAAAIVTAILIGDRAGLDDEVEQRLQAAGTYHVIAISGGNVAILAGLILGVLRMLRFAPRTAHGAAIGLLTVYAMVVEGGSSVTRATMMAVTCLGARLLDHDTPPLNSVALAGGLVLALDPLALFDAGFLLTFGATIGILIGVWWVTNRVLGAGCWVLGAGERVLGAEGQVLGAECPVLGADGRVPHPAPRAPHGARGTHPRAFFRGVVVLSVSLLAASLAAEAALLPLTATLFSRVTFIGLALNFAAIPLMTVVQIAGLGVVALSSLAPALASVAGYIAQMASTALTDSAKVADWLPLLSPRVPAPAAALVILYYAAWIGLVASSTAAIVAAIGATRPVMVVWTRRICVAVIGSTAVLIVAGEVPTLRGPWLSALAGVRSPPRLRITMVDVGQGDAILLQCPNGRSLLIDTGGVGSGSRFDIGGRILAPVLWARHVRRLDYLALTHGDPDHIGGAPSVLADFRPREIWAGVPVPRSEPLNALMSQAGQMGTAWRTLVTGEALSLGGVELRVLHPSTPDWERQRVRNDDSLVIDVRYGDVAMLLTGDIGREVERQIAGAIEPAALRLVKVPHHGSLTSSSAELLDAIRPAAAFVSAGRGNRFGHPAPAVLDRYRRAGVEMFRTDRDGAITIETDGNQVEISTWTGRHLRLRAPRTFQR